jgi:hypothetical protein
MQEENEKRKKVDTLIFIYDADSGKLGAFLDSTKKLLMIGGCALCAITHGILGEKNEWKECREELGVPITYYHKDEIPEFLKGKVAGHLPCIVALVGKIYVILLEPAVLKRCRGDVRDLKGRINYYLAANNLTL